MRNLIFSILILITSIKYSYSQNFKEIYDFDVNDVFQYKTTWNGEDMRLYETIKKYSIDNKEIIGDTIKYFITGKELYHTYVYDYSLDQSSYHYYEVSEINSTLIYIDSASNFLNKSVGSLASIAIPYHDDTVLTRILHNRVDGIKTKIIGGDTETDNSNLFINTTDTTILDTINGGFIARRYKLMYSEKLGLIEEDYWGFEYGHLMKLEGYIKNGDTTGIITPDLNFTGINKVTTSKINVYPNPAKDYIHFDFDESLNLKAIKILDLNGIELIHSKSTGKLYIGNLKRGIYLIKIIDADDICSTFKLLKEQ